MSKPSVALAVAAHPDDIEFFMSGTLMRLGECGYELHYWNLANGCCGTSQYDAATIARMRREEGLNAAASIGAVFHESLCNDLEIFYDKPTLQKLADRGIELPVFASPTIPGVTLHDTDIIYGQYRERMLEAQQKHLPQFKKSMAKEG